MRSCSNCHLGNGLSTRSAYAIGSSQAGIGKGKLSKDIGGGSSGGAVVGGFGFCFCVTCC